VTIFHVADLHSHLLPRRLAIGPRDSALGLGPEGDSVSVGGAARLGALLDRERGRSDASFFFDAGDLLEGTSVYSVFGGVPEVLAVDRLKLDAAAVGNHDLSRGASALAALRAGRTSSPLLAANLDDVVAAGVAARYATFERGGVRVLAVGLGRTPDGAVSLDACASAVERAIAEAAPADVVLVLSHLGRELDLALVPRTSGVDLILGGHTHDVLDPPATVMDCGPELRAQSGCEPRPVTVAHPGAYGRYLGRIDLVVSADPALRTERAGHASSAVVESHVALLPVNAALPDRADIAELLRPYADRLAQAGFEKPFAFAPALVSREPVGGGDSALGNFVARAMRLSVGADFALVNTTGIRADLPKGVLTPDDFFEVLPFDDALVTLAVSGADLENALSDVARASCARNRTSQAAIDGGTVVLGCSPARAVASIAGRPVDPGGVYRVATVSFVSEGRGQWLSGVGTHSVGGPPIRDIATAAARKAAPCRESGSGDLPCVDSTAGAAADGRITWQ